MSDLAPAPAPKKSTRKRNLILGGLAIAAAIGGSVFWYFRHGRDCQTLTAFAATPFSCFAMKS